MKEIRKSWVVTCKYSIQHECYKSPTYEYSIAHPEYSLRQSPLQVLLTKHMTADIASYLRLKQNFRHQFYKWVEEYYIWSPRYPSLPKILPFWRTFLHIVALRFPKCFLSFSILQSVIGNDLLSKGSAHFGSPSDRQTQHLMESP